MTTLREWTEQHTPKPRALTEDEVFDLVTNLDPTSPLAQGRLKAIAARITDDSDPARALVERLQSVPTKRAPDASFDNPTKVRKSGERKPLTAADLALIERLPSDPAAVEREDVIALAEMWERRSPGSDTRLLEKVYGPIHRHWTLLEAQKRRNAALLHDPTSSMTADIERLAVDVLAKKMRARLPGELRDQEVRARAQERLTAAIAARKEERRREIDAAESAYQRCLAEPSTLVSDSERSMEAGRQRGREAAASSGTTSPLDGFQLVGQR